MFQHGYLYNVLYRRLALQPPLSWLIKAVGQNYNTSRLFLGSRYALNRRLWLVYLTCLHTDFDLQCSLYDKAVCVRKQPNDRYSLMM